MLQDPIQVRPVGRAGGSVLRRGASRALAISAALLCAACWGLGPISPDGTQPLPGDAPEEPGSFEIVAISPAPGATDVPLDAVVAIVFSRATSRPTQATSSSEHPAEAL